MIKNSVGNITEILELLDKEKYTGLQLEENYKYLVDKWGELEIVGKGYGGFTIRYVDVGNAFFSGLMITFGALTIISFLSALIFGKMIFPLLVKYYKNNNDELVDMATLKSASQIDEMSTKQKKEWF